MQIKIELPEDYQEQKYALSALRDMYTNISDLEQIYNICRGVVKHGANAEEAIEEIKELSFRDYEG